MVKKNLLSSCLFLLPLFGYAQDFHFNKYCEEAYHEIIKLKLEQGRLLLQQEKERNPKNLIPVYLENYIDFLYLFANGSETDIDHLKENKSKRLSLINRGNQESPYFLYAQAEIYLQWAIIKIKFGEYLSAFFDLRRAYKSLEENIDKFPGFTPNRKSFGLIKALLGSIPSRYNWGIRLFGMDGNSAHGIQMLKDLLDLKEDFIYQEEVINIYCSFLFHLEGKSGEAWEILRQTKYPIEGNLFSFYTSAKIALFSNNNDEAIRILSLAPKGNKYLDFPMLEYYGGMARLNKLDTQAIVHFKKFIRESKGKDLIKATYQKIAWSYFINGDMDQYNFYMNQVIENGRMEIEADKQAEKEAKGKHPPELTLLKARLLCDGGYLTEARDLIESKRTTDYNLFQYQLELVYRKGRIMDALNNDTEAIKYYQQTINLGADAPYYYAANAALNLAFLYESERNIAQAKKYYRKCIDMNNHEYKLSLNQKAKAGLQRLE